MIFNDCTVVTHVVTKSEMSTVAKWLIRVHDVF